MDEARRGASLMRFFTHAKSLRWLLVLPGILAIGGVAAYPLVWTVRSAFSYYHLGSPTGFAGWFNFQRLLDSERFWNALVNTVVYTVAAVSLEMILGLALAMLFNQRLKGRPILRALLIAPMMISPVVAAVVWRLLYDPRVGVLSWAVEMTGVDPPLFLANPDIVLASLVMVDVWQWTPFMFLFILAGLQGRPVEPYEAASIDGASSWQMFRDLTLPFIRNAIVIGILIRSIEAFRTFDQVVILTGGGPGTSSELISPLIFNQSFSFLDFGLAGATILVLLLIALPLGYFYIRLLSPTQGRDR